MRPYLEALLLTRPNPVNVAEAVAVLRNFLGTLASALAEGRPFDRAWKKAGPWRNFFF